MAASLRLCSMCGSVRMLLRIRGYESLHQNAKYVRTARNSVTGTNEDVEPKPKFNASVSSKISFVDHDEYDFFGINNKNNTFTDNATLDIAVIKSKYFEIEKEKDDCAEKVIIMNFGTIRFDSDNVVNYHGQYDTNLVLQNTEDSKKPTRISQSQNDKMITETPEMGSRIAANEYRDTLKAQNIIDEQYFPQTSNQMFDDSLNVASSIVDNSLNNFSGDTKYTSTDAIKNSEKSFEDQKSINPNDKTDSRSNESMCFKETKITEFDFDPFYVKHIKSSQSTESENLSEHPENSARSDITITGLQFPHAQVTAKTECEHSHTYQTRIHSDEENYTIKAKRPKNTSNLLNVDAASNTEEELPRNIIPPETNNAKVKREDKNSHDQKTSAYDYVREKRQKSKMGQTGENSSEVEPHKVIKNLVQDLRYLHKELVLHMLKSSVVYNENDIVAFNKPYGMASHGPEDKVIGRSMTTFLPELARELNPNDANAMLYPVHRLDRDTTGILLFAKTPETARRLSNMFKERKIEKVYWAVTKGVPSPLEGIINIPIMEGRLDGKERMVLFPELTQDLKPLFRLRGDASEAITYYKTLQFAESAALLHVKPETGVKHQIRVHLGLGLRCAVLGDHKYSSLTKMVPQKLSGDILDKLKIRQSKARYVPMLLHAKNVVIPESDEGRNIIIKAELPTHFVKLLKVLDLDRKK